MFSYLRPLPGAFLLLLAACAVTGPTAEERLGNALPVKRGMQIIDREQHSRNVTCGRYHTLAANGFSTVTRRFIVTPERVFTQPRERDFAVLCSDDPALALREELGIEPKTALDWQRVRRIHRDLKALAEAMARYRERQIAQPRSLEQLLGDDALENAQLYDPWGRPYQFRPGLGGPLITQPDLACLGADARPGGRGPDADIHLRDLPLIDHVLLLAGY